MENKELSLKEIQEESFKVLLKIKEIFEKNHWTYFLMYGTLLGAIRHNGFIPWDDDIDIWVPRKDYEKFVEYCINNKEELGSFELHHYKTNDKYIYPIARFSNSEFRTEYTDAKEYGLGTFVDIYPIDGVKPETLDRDFKVIKKKSKLICLLGFSHYVRSKSTLKNIIKYPYYQIIKHKNLNKQLRKIDNLGAKHSLDECDYCNCMCWADEKLMIDKKDIFPVQSHCFNGVDFSIPKDYDKILKYLYGDYMKLPPESERIAHHYYKTFRK